MLNVGFGTKLGLLRAAVNHGKP